MNKDDILQHLYELSYALDSYSASKDYEALRRLHYDNINWLKDNGLDEDYYKVLFTHIQEEQNQQSKEDDYKPDNFSNFAELYNRYMFREIGKVEFARILNISQETLERLLRDFTQKK